MKSKMTNTTAFLYDLQQLLRKYDARLTADDHYRGLPGCGQDIRISIDIEGIYEDMQFTHIDVAELDEAINRRIIDNT